MADTGKFTRIPGLSVDLVAEIREAAEAAGIPLQTAISALLLDAHVLEIRVLVGAVVELAGTQRSGDGGKRLIAHVLAEELEKVHVVNVTPQGEGLSSFVSAPARTRLDEAADALGMRIGDAARFALGSYQGQVREAVSRGLARALSTKNP